MGVRTWLSEPLSLVLDADHGCYAAAKTHLGYFNPVFSNCVVSPALPGRSVHLLDPVRFCQPRPPIELPHLSLPIVTVAAGSPLLRFESTYSTVRSKIWRTLPTH